MTNEKKEFNSTIETTAFEQAVASYISNSYNIEYLRYVLGDDEVFPVQNPEITKTLSEEDKEFSVIPTKLVASLFAQYLDTKTHVTEANFPPSA
jgi:hypothetical protein